jgi:hypothetical protein
MAIAQRTAAELKQLIKVQLEDHGIWAYVRVNPCSGNGWVATVKADHRYLSEYQAVADAIVGDLRQHYALKREQ